MEELGTAVVLSEEEFDLMLAEERDKECERNGWPRDGRERIREQRRREREERSRKW